MAVICSKQIAVPASGKLASDYAVGESVFLDVNGVSKEFLVVNQGIPSNSSSYDSSCNGTWLLMKDAYESRTWDSSDNNYGNSDIHDYLNGDFLALLDTKVQSAIKQVKIPWQNNTGSNGLSTKIFLLSAYEVGWTTTNPSGYISDIEGACLKYFSGTSTTDSKRICYQNGTAVEWFLRTPNFDFTTTLCTVYTNGSCGSEYCGVASGIRPALVLPSNASFNSDTNKFMGVK